jgi:hypothetical protein
MVQTPAMALFTPKYRSQPKIDPAKDPGMLKQWARSAASGGVTSKLRDAQAKQTELEKNIEAAKKAKKGDKEIRDLQDELDHVTNQVWSLRKESADRAKAGKDRG